MTWLKSRLTYANIMSTIAAFLALGGVAWASTQLPRNSVGTAQLTKNAVTGAKVKNGSLTAADLKPGTLSTGPAGPAGPAGATGPAGPKGEQGPAGTGPAYTASRVASPLLTVQSSLSPVVASPTLPAGSYVVIARANVVASGGVQNTLLCTLEDDAIQAWPLASGAVAPLTMATTLTLAAPATVSLSCSKSSGAPLVAQASIIATRVTAINPG